MTEVDRADSSTRSPAANLILIGASGSGKTAVGRRVAERAGWDLVDTDAEIIRSSSIERISDVFDQHGEARFRELEEACIRRLEDGQVVRTVIATGGGLPAIPGMIDRLNRLGSTVYLKATLDQLWKRLNMDPSELQDRPLLRSNGREKLDELLSARGATYSRATITLDTGSLSVAEVCELLLAHVGSRAAD